MIAAVRTFHFRATISATAEGAACVRPVVRGHLQSCGYAAEVVDGAMLSTAELMANAVQHGSASEHDTVTVMVDCEANHVRITVADGSSLLPRLRGVDAMAERGRGLAIIDEISDSWGADAAVGGHGKQVWCTLLVGEAASGVLGERRVAAGRLPQTE